MEYSFLGNSGLKISKLGLGSNTFGKVDTDDVPLAVHFQKPNQFDESSAHAILDRYTELGGNFIDTADVYAAGRTETIIGNWLKTKSRDDIVIATKVGILTPDVARTSPNACGLSRRHVVKSVEQSLARLQTDSIDLYQAHMWDNATPLEETLRTFDDLVRCGKIRHYGYSNVCGWQMQKIVDTTKQLNLTPCISLQQEYNLLQRHSELEAFQVCQNEGVGVLTWSPLKGGTLTGKYKRDAEPDVTEGRAGYFRHMKSLGKTTKSYWEDVCDDEQYWKLIHLMRTIAEKHDKTVAHVAIRWLLQQKVVSSVVLGVTSLQQLEANMAASIDGWILTEQEMTELSDTSPRPKYYPHTLIWTEAQTYRHNPAKKY